MAVTPLDPDRALELARTLTLVADFPRFQEAIEASASDLIRWCKGAKIGDRFYTPEDQAIWLTTEAREKLEKFSTVRLYDLFKQKFQPASKPANTAVDWSNQPCPCGSGQKFKDCCKGKPAPPVDLSWWEEKTTLAPRSKKLPSADELQRAVASQIREAEAILADPDAPQDRREIAGAVLKMHQGPLPQF